MGAPAFNAGLNLHCLTQSTAAAPKILFVWLMIFSIFTLPSGSTMNVTVAAPLIVRSRSSGGNCGSALCMITGSLSPGASFPASFIGVKNSLSLSCLLGTTQPVRAVNVMNKTNERIMIEPRSTFGLSRAHRERRTEAGALGRLRAGGGFHERKGTDWARWLGQLALSSLRFLDDAGEIESE